MDTQTYKPKLLPFVFSAIFPALFGLAFMVFSSLIFVGLYLYFKSLEFLPEGQAFDKDFSQEQEFYFNIVFFLVAGYIFIFGFVLFYKFFIRFFSYKKVSYKIDDKGVKIKQNKKTYNIDYENIVEIILLKYQNGKSGLGSIFLKLDKNDLIPGGKTFIICPQKSNTKYAFALYGLNNAEDIAEVIQDKANATFYTTLGPLFFFDIERNKALYKEV